MTLQDIWNNRSWRFTFWLTSALLAYRTAPDTGVSMYVSVLTGLVYIVMWLLLLRLDAGAEERVSPLVGFMLVLIALALVTLISSSLGYTITIIAVFWLVPVGMPLQGLVRLFSYDASRSDGAMAAVTMVFLAVLLGLRFLWARKKR